MRRSPKIYQNAKDNPVKPQLGDESSPQMETLPVVHEATGYDQKNFKIM